MGTILSFRGDSRERLVSETHERRVCEIVIFPGVRIERQSAAAAPEASPSAPRGKIDGATARRRSRKTS